MTSSSLSRPCGVTWRRAEPHAWQRTLGNTTQGAHLHACRVAENLLLVRKSRRRSARQRGKAQQSERLRARVSACSVFPASRGFAPGGGPAAAAPATLRRPARAHARRAACAACAPLGRALRQRGSRCAQRAPHAPQDGARCARKTPAGAANANAAIAATGGEQTDCGNRRAALAARRAALYNRANTRPRCFVACGETPARFQRFVTLTEKSPRHAPHTAPQRPGSSSRTRALSAAGSAAGGSARRPGGGAPPRARPRGGGTL